jgi:hypothetical protein
MMHWHAVHPFALQTFGVFRMQGPHAGDALKIELTHVAMQDHETLLDQQ